MMLQLLLVPVGIFAIVSGQSPTQYGGNPIGQAASDASISIIGPDIGGIGAQQSAGNGPQMTYVENLEQVQNVNISTDVSQINPVQQPQTQNSQAAVSQSPPIIFPISPIPYGYNSGPSNGNSGPSTCNSVSSIGNSGPPVPTCSCGTAPSNPVPPTIPGACSCGPVPSAPQSTPYDPNLPYLN